MPVPPPADPPVDTHGFDLPALQALPQPAQTTWELSAFYTGMSISEPPRPYYSKMVLGVDAVTGMILAFQLGAPDQTMAQTAARGLVQSI